MYNGIGLQTARGSGTNGYVQTNKAFVRHHKDRVDYKSEEEIKKLEAQMIKQPNKEILDHERKRKVELKCMEMEELMEEQGYTKEEIDSKVALFRKMLMDKEGVQEGSSVEKDEFGRPIAKQTHQIAEATAEKNARLKEAFGISDYYQDGSSFDPNRKAKEEAAKALAMAHKKYAIVQDSDSASETSPSPSPQKQKKKSRDKSESVERKSSKKKKSKKHRNDRSESRKSKKRKNKHKKRDSGEKRKKHKRHTSPSSDSESSTDDDKKGSGESEEEEASQPHKSPEKVREQVLKSGSAERRPRQEVKGRSGSLSSLASSPSPFSTTDPQSLAWTG
ncbi:serine/arginine repetitive matrix protein 2-like [Dreissena polymorpha]|uniref:serine/arginine repetitive matrix protein 2-like n=1 Tax=Dreissena polymorpha TaxID=45954 RepID=UPI002264D5C7|nr:serine/arginine repetitive matrix protein 2-like [Dreissena polymorpha]XP_052261169.1 serine/arginine repetitive matrix protein 2-like [Dreissena polymorpha]XP_052261170.1 serine/arginine repetitive matrix protein 2-like [Dreissena polymorpha]XP_052261171.1 serine/arginine repetitive matrix protein 2-like [Dreissena polymorpha]